jgi:hypothetical protein
VDYLLASEERLLHAVYIDSCVTYITLVALGCQLLACLPLQPKFEGSNPVEDDEAFKGDKNP